MVRFGFIFITAIIKCSHVNKSHKISCRARKKKKKHNKKATKKRKKKNNKKKRRKICKGSWFSHDNCVGVLLCHILINFIRLHDVFRGLFQSVSRLCGAHFLRSISRFMRSVAIKFNLWGTWKRRSNCYFKCAIIFWGDHRCPIIIFVRLLR